MSVLLTKTLTLLLIRRIGFVLKNDQELFLHLRVSNLLITFLSRS